MPGFLGMLAQGFANAGQNVAAFAGDAATIQMKSDLERQSQVLANQLATERETTLEAQRQAGAQTLQAGQQTFTAGQTEKEHEFQTGQTQAEIASRERLPALTANAQVAATKQEAENAAAQTIANSNDPNYLAGVTKLANANPAMASEINERNAQAMLARASAGLTGLQTQTSAQLFATKKAIIDEQGKANPDQDKLAKLNQQYSTLAMDPATMTAARTAAVGMARLSEDAATRAQAQLNTLVEQQRNAININPGDPKAGQEFSDQITDMRSRVKTITQEAEDARATANSYFGSNTKKAEPAPAGPTAGASPANPAKPKSREEAAALHKGTWFVDPSGAVIQRN